MMDNWTLTINPDHGERTFIRYTNISYGKMREESDRIKKELLAQDNVQYIGGVDMISVYGYDFKIDGQTVKYTWAQDKWY